MKRSTYRTIVSVSVIGLFAIAGGVFMQCQNVEQAILARQGDLTRLMQELENVKNISASQIELDKLTIDENTATQLDILRHLGIEKSNLDFMIQGKEETRIGDTMLVAHVVHFGGIMSYALAMELCDRLQNARKIVFTTIAVKLALTPPADQDLPPDAVELALDGKIYGLSKQQLPPKEGN